MKKFNELGLNPNIIKALDELKFVEPTPIQAESIPFILESKQDLVGLAQTGTGKTAGFALPIINQIKDNKNIQAIILCPTRELCLQINRDIESFTKYSKKVNVTPVYGGQNINTQIRALKKGTQIVVGTSGRVSDLIRRNVLKLGNVRWLVLDEADEMLDMGFKDDLDAILDQTPVTRQTLLFSATMSKSVASIAKHYMKKSHEISVGDKNSGAKNVSHKYFVVKAGERFEALTRILDSLPGVYGILFCRTRRETQDVADKLKKIHYSAEAIHGEISQNMRTKIMDRFRQKRIHLLVATDVAARGIDVDDLTHVINYNLPDSLETYTHRSGRTGRANKKGVSMLIVSRTEARKIKRIESIVGKTFEHAKIPSGKQAFERQLDNFIEEIKNVTDESGELDKHADEINDKLKNVTKQDLIKYLISDKIGRFLKKSQQNQDLNVDPSRSVKGEDDANMTRFKINVGKADGLNIKEFFRLINSQKKLKGIEIGQIDLLPDHAYFSVEKDRSADVKRVFRKIKFKGKNVLLIPAKPKDGGSRGGGGKSRKSHHRKGRSRRRV